MDAYAALPSIDWSAIDPADRAQLAVQGILDPRYVARVRSVEQAQMHDPALRLRPRGGIWL